MLVKLFDHWFNPHEVVGLQLCDMRHPKDTDLSPEEHLERNNTSFHVQIWLSSGSCISLQRKDIDHIASEINNAS